MLVYSRAFRAKVSFPNKSPSSSPCVYCISSRSCTSVSASFQEQVIMHTIPPGTVDSESTLGPPPFKSSRPTLADTPTAGASMSIHEPMHERWIYRACSLNLPGLLYPHRLTKLLSGAKIHGLLRMNLELRKYSALTQIMKHYATFNNTFHLPHSHHTSDGGRII
jgi:hypothetical protein